MQIKVHIDTELHSIDDKNEYVHMHLLDEALKDRDYYSKRLDRAEATGPLNRQLPNPLKTWERGSAWCEGCCWQVCPVEVDGEILCGHCRSNKLWSREKLEAALAKLNQVGQPPAENEAYVLIDESDLRKIWEKNDSWSPDYKALLALIHSRVRYRPAPNRKENS